MSFIYAVRRAQWQDLFDSSYEARQVARAALLAGAGDAATHSALLPNVQELQVIV